MAQSVVERELAAAAFNFPGNFSGAREKAHATFLIATAAHPGDMLTMNTRLISNFLEKFTSLQFALADPQRIAVLGQLHSASLLAAREAAQ
jgi:hypothetical protein